MTRFTAEQLAARRARIARLEAKRPPPAVTVHRTDDPQCWSALVRLLADLLDKPATPDERR